MSKKPLPTAWELHKSRMQKKKEKKKEKNEFRNRFYKMIVSNMEYMEAYTLFEEELERELELEKKQA